MLTIRRFGSDTEYPVLLPDDDVRVNCFPELIPYFAAAGRVMGTWPVPEEIAACPPKLGHLYWPIFGAARYAHAIVLLDGHTLAQITGEDITGIIDEDGDTIDDETGDPIAGEDANNGVQLAYRDEQNEDPMSPETPRTFDMYIAAVRPWSKTGTRPAFGDPVPAEDDAWIVLLVDARYYWMQSTVNPGQIAGSALDTWELTIQALTKSLSDNPPPLTITDAPDPAYLTPTDRWSLPFMRGKSAAHLLDAAAAAVGSRIVCAPDGSLELQRPTSANRAIVSDAHDALVADNRFHRGGPIDADDCKITIPATAFVNFPNDEAVSATVGGESTGNKVAATFDTPIATTGPTERNALASKWASDFYEWNIVPLDAQYVGVIDLPMSGFLSFADIKHTRHECKTRLARPPVNYCPLYIDDVDNEALSGSSCADCDFLFDRDALISVSSGSAYPPNALRVRFLHGSGRCSCWREQGNNPLDPWTALYDADQDLWILTRNGQTCCSCFFLTINIPDPGNGTISARLHIKKSCDGVSKDIGYDLIFQGCCTRNGVSIATLVGYGTDLCDGEPPFPCTNTFVVEVWCADCDLPVAPECTECLETCAPPIFRAVGTFSGDHDVYNSAWFLHPVEGSPCEWDLQCPDPTIDGATTVSVHAQLTRNGSDQAVMTVTFSGGPGSAQYQVTETGFVDFLCYVPHTLTRVSGDALKTPASIVVTPFNCAECPSKCMLINYATVVADVISSSGTCNTLTLTPVSFSEDTTDFSCTIGTFFSGLAHLTCTPEDGLTFAIDTASGPYTVNVTTVSKSFDPFEWTIDLHFTTVSPPAPAACDSTYRITFTD